MRSRAPAALAHVTVRWLARSLGDRRLMEAAYKKDLTEGDVFLKHGKKGKPHNRHASLRALQYRTWRQRDPARDADTW